ncbi:MAG: hypothetical protein FVQ80_06165 [Planctomycetes bacterium]|nr:hypothetical protein [Planctomycetota bacterium]
MKVLKTSFCVIVLLFLFVSAGIILASNTDNHTVTVTVTAINELEIIGGNITLTINTATAGSNPDDQTDSTTADLNWTTNEASKKITILSNILAASANFTLTAEATSISGGTATAPQTPTTTAADFITGVATTIGTCDLTYVGSATAAEGTGSDAHTITYTLTAV